MLWHTAAAVDTPATIAILGIGPLALEAALYGRYLGYDTRLFTVADDSASLPEDRDRLGQPFGALCSKLGLAALHAQDARWRPPNPGDAITAETWRTAYLAPLAESDLLIDIATAPPRLTRIVPLAAEGPANLEHEVDSPEPDASDSEHSIDDDSTHDPDGESSAAPVSSCSHRPLAWRPKLRVSVQVIIDASRSTTASAEWASGPIERQPFAGATISRRGPHSYLIAAASDAEPAAGFQRGLQEIRALFALIGGREALDLDATMDRLLP